MASGNWQDQLDEVIEKIEETWNNEQSRDGKWGPTLKAVMLKNIRGVTATLPLDWPIVVIGGQNRSGKSTFLQVCSMAYNDLGKYIWNSASHWFPPPIGEETPVIIESSHIRFQFWREDLDFGFDAKLSKVGKGRYGLRNTGFGKIQPKKVVLIDISEDVPPAEREYLEMYGSGLRRERQIRVEGCEDVSHILDHLNPILGIPFERAQQVIVLKDNGKRLDPIPQLTTDGISYLNRNMGAGELRMFGLVLALAKLPKQSLILLEEPEVTLHPEVHWRLANSLMRLCNLGHQIIITTHSPALFRAFPPKARVFLSRDEKGTHVFPEAESLMVEHELAGLVHTNKDLVLVEDEVARVFFEFILNRFNRRLQEQVSVVVFGSRTDIQRAVEALRNNGVRSVGVRDTDVGQNQLQGLFSIPRGKSIEHLLLESDNIGRACSKISELDKLYKSAASKCRELNETKLWKCRFEALSTELDWEKRKLEETLIDAWLDVDQNRLEAKSLLDNIKVALSKVSANLPNREERRGTPKKQTGF